MIDHYRDVDFDCFSEGGQVPLTKEEQKRILSGFYSSQAVARKKRRVSRGIALAVAVFMFCLILTPIREVAWASVKELCYKIGTYMGMEKQDDYANKIGQTITKDGVSVTLNEVVAGQDRVRFSATFQSETGNPPNIDDFRLYIDGTKTDGGWGCYGSEKVGQKRIFYGSGSHSLEMADKSNVQMDLNVGNQWFSFKFVLDNTKIKQETKVIAINKTISDGKREIKLKNLVVTPIDQKITFDNVNNEDLLNLYDWILYGTDNLGNKVEFGPAGLFNYYEGYRDNDDNLTWELDPDVSSYTLRMYDLDGADRKDLWNEKNAISEEFSIKIK